MLSDLTSRWSGTLSFLLIFVCCGTWAEVHRDFEDDSTDSVDEDYSVFPPRMAKHQHMLRMLDELGEDMNTDDPSDVVSAKKFLAVHSPAQRSQSGIRNPLEDVRDKSKLMFLHSSGSRGNKAAEELLPAFQHMLGVSASFLSRKLSVKMYPGGNKTLGKLMLLVMVCVAAVTAFFKKCCGNRLDIRRIACIKEAFLKYGIDKYPDFQLHMTIHEVHMDEYHRSGVHIHKSEFGIHIACGSWKKDFESDMVGTEGEEPLQGDFQKIVMYQQPVSISVKQGTSAFTFALRDAKSKSTLAEGSLDIFKKIWTADHDAMRTSVSLKRTSKGKKCYQSCDPMVFFTFVREVHTDVEEAPSQGENDSQVEGELKRMRMTQSMKAQMAIAQAELDAHKERSSRPGSEDELDLTGEDPVIAEGHQQLLILALTCGGNMKVSSKMGMKDTPVTLRLQFDECRSKEQSVSQRSIWYFRCWNLAWYKEDSRASTKGKPQGMIPMMSVMNVLAEDTEEKHHFHKNEVKSDLIVRFSNAKGKTEDMRFICADCSREVKIEAIKVFIHQMRFMLDTIKENTKARKSRLSPDPQDQSGASSSSKGSVKAFKKFGDSSSDSSAHRSKHSSHKHKAQESPPSSDTDVDKSCTGTTKLKRKSKSRG